MRKLYTLKGLMTALLLTIGNIAMAGDHFMADSVMYAILSDNDLTCEVVGKLLSDDTAITIPEKVTNDGKTYTVTAIGENAFRGESALVSVKIPSSVTTIGSAAFANSTAVTNVDMPNSVTERG